MAEHIGILAIQGDIEAHEAAVRRCAAEPVRVLRKEHLDGLRALILPGGESTTMWSYVSPSFASTSANVWLFHLVVQPVKPSSSQAVPTLQYMAPVGNTATNSSSSAF